MSTHYSLDDRDHGDERVYPKALLSQQIHVERMIARPKNPAKEIVGLLLLIANPKSLHGGIVAWPTDKS